MSSFFLFSHLKCDRLKDLVAEHLDHLHYLHDILSLNIQDVNDVLTGHFINRLLIPLYIYSLVKDRPDVEQVCLLLRKIISFIYGRPQVIFQTAGLLLRAQEMADIPKWIF